MVAMNKRMFYYGTYRGDPVYCVANPEHRVIWSATNEEYLTLHSLKNWDYVIHSDIADWCQSGYSSSSPIAFAVDKAEKMNRRVPFALLKS